jgi:hypothetical protein
VPLQIERIKTMIPKMILFHNAPELFEKLYTHGEKMSQIPINPVSQSCHIIYTPFMIFDVNVNVVKNI